MNVKYYLFASASESFLTDEMWDSDFRKELLPSSALSATLQVTPHPYPSKEGEKSTLNVFNPSLNLIQLYTFGLGNCDRTFRKVFFNYQHEALNLPSLVCPLSYALPSPSHHQLPSFYGVSCYSPVKCYTTGAVWTGGVWLVADMARQLETAASTKEYMN